MTGRDLLEQDSLRAFAVFAEHRNFTAAAAALHISQPSLHVKIRKLADALGVSLYERQGRRLRLTGAGERLAEYALDNRHRLDEFMQQFHQDLPPLTIAVGRGALRWVVADPIRHLTRQGRRIHVRTADREAALAALSTGAADLAVVHHDAPAGFPHVKVASYRQNLVVDARHPLAARPTVRLSALNGLRLVVPGAGRAHRRAIDRALRDANVSWHPAVEIDGWDLMVHLADLGMGAAIVNSCVTLTPRLVGIPIVDLPAVDYWAAWSAETHEQIDDWISCFRT